jgi:3D-(3,5/4)-trihydroxycyclohexane-1,2-dione acylhydrolase (decyclizing)
MLHTEIVTSIQEGHKLTIVLVDNGGFQCIKGLQMSAGSPHFGNELRFRDDHTGRLEGDFVPVDFAMNAESLGAVALRAASEGALREALARAKEIDRTVLIYVPVDKDARVPGFESWWDVPVAQVSGQQGVQDALSRYEENLEKQRFYY